MPSGFKVFFASVKFICPSNEYSTQTAVNYVFFISPLNSLIKNDCRARGVIAYSGRRARWPQRMYD
jgi:hypothetical protein